jgi:hypothetical protein
MTPRIEALLEEIALHLSSLAGNAEAVTSIEQALSDVVLGLEAIKPGDTSAIVAAIKGLQLTVNVSPTPVQVHVAPAPVHLAAAEIGPFVPLRLKIVRNTANGLLDFVDVFERPKA